MKKFYLFIVLFIFGCFLYSNIIYIPTDYATIQAGIDNAAAGDSVIFYPGTYEESIVIDKVIVLGFLM